MKLATKKEIEEINAEIELKKSEVIKKQSDYELDLEERKLNMTTIDKRGQIEAENQATLYTFLSKIFKEFCIHLYSSLTCSFLSSTCVAALNFATLLASMSVKELISIGIETENP